MDNCICTGTWTQFWPLASLPGDHLLQPDYPRQITSVQNWSCIPILLREESLRGRHMLNCWMISVIGTATKVPDILYPRTLHRELAEVTADISKKIAILTTISGFSSLFSHTPHLRLSFSELKAIFQNVPGFSIQPWLSFQLQKLSVNFDSFLDIKPLLSFAHSLKTQSLQWLKSSYSWTFGPTQSARQAALLLHLLCGLTVKN